MIQTTKLILFSQKKNKENARKEMIKHFGKDVKVPGFREGYVPAHIVEEQIKPEYIEM
jgi:FKBP-type peptidyl-prolyl cis-trans isomerase (trigger factor)